MSKEVQASRLRQPAPLMTAEQTAREIFNVSERTFQKFRDEDWMPRPVILSARVLRWVRAEVEAAALGMPRLRERQPEPAQLRAVRGRINEGGRGG